MQTTHRVGHFAAGVQTALEVVVVKLDVKGFQVEVLLVTQVGNGKFAHAVHIVHIAAGGEFAVIGLDGFAGQEIGGDVLDVVAVIERFALRVLGIHRPAVITRLETLSTEMCAFGQGVDLHARVVVIKLAVDVETLRGKQIANRIAQSRLAAVAYVQRAGRVGRHKLDQHALAVVHLETELFFGGQHLAHDLLFGRRLQTDVDKAGACNFNVLHPLLVHGRSQQRVAQLFAELTGIELEGLGQLHRSGNGEVAMCSDFGRFKSSLVAGTGQQTVEGLAQGGQQFLFNLEHG